MRQNPCNSLNWSLRYQIKWPYLRWASSFMPPRHYKPFPYTNCISLEYTRWIALVSFLPCKRVVQNSPILLYTLPCTYCSLLLFCQPILAPYGSSFFLWISLLSTIAQQASSFLKIPVIQHQTFTSLPQASRPIVDAPFFVNQTSYCL